MTNFQARFIAFFAGLPSIWVWGAVATTPTLFLIIFSLAWVIGVWHWPIPKDK